MTPAKIIRELDGFRGSAALVEFDGNHYVVSSVSIAFTGPETLVFPSDEHGVPTDWLEVAGGRGMSRDEAIEDLEAGPRVYD